MRSTALSTKSGIAISMVVLACLAEPAGGTRPANGETPALGIAGNWQLQPKLSEDGQALLKGALAKREATSSPAPTSGAGARSGGGRHGGRGGGGGGASAATGAITAGADDSIAMGEFAAVRERLEIRVSAGDVAFGAEPKPAVHYDTTVGWLRSEDGHEVRAQWKNGALVIESRWNTGTRIKTTYSLLVEHERLEAVSHLDLSTGISATVRRVYAASEASTSR